MPESIGCEVQIGGPDVLTYADMLDRMALALGKVSPSVLLLRSADHLRPADQAELIAANLRL